MSSEFFKFENAEYDIPFYNGNPPLTTPKIIALIVELIIAFLAPYVFTLEVSQIPKIL